MTVYYKDVAKTYELVLTYMNETIYKKNLKDTPNAIGVISCKNLCLELPSQATDYFLKRNISHNCGNFL